MSWSNHIIRSPICDLRSHSKLETSQLFLSRCRASDPERFSALERTISRSHHEQAYTGLLNSVALSSQESNEIENNFF